MVNREMLSSAAIHDLVGRDMRNVSDQFRTFIR
jgi:hypothetical protein